VFAERQDRTAEAIPVECPFGLWIPAPGLTPHAVRDIPRRGNAGSDAITAKGRSRRYDAGQWVGGNSTPEGRPSQLINEPAHE